MQRLLVFSLLLNSLLVGCIGLMILRLGGWQYAAYRLQNSDAGAYQHRKSLFETLPVKKGAIVLLGDSQIEQCEWRELLGDSLPILNRGIVGDYAEGVEKRLKEVMRHRPSRIFLCMGVNDLLLGKSPDQTEEKYRVVVQRLRKEAPAAQLVLISVLPVNNSVKRIGIANNEIRELNIRIKEIAREYAVQFVDLYEQLAGNQGDLPSDLTDDGLHLNGKGYAVFKKAIQGALR